MFLNSLLKEGEKREREILSGGICNFRKKVGLKTRNTFDRERGEGKTFCVLEAWAKARSQENAQHFLGMASG